MKLELLVLGILGLGVSNLPPISKEVQHVLDEFSSSYPNEVAVCLTGKDSINGWYLPNIKQAFQRQINVDKCDFGTLAHWHSHPKVLLNNGHWRVFFYRETGRAPESTKDLCYLSNQDVNKLREQETVKYAIVGVDKGLYCWWTMEQLNAAGDFKEQILWPLEEQLVLPK